MRNALVPALGLLLLGSGCQKGNSPDQLSDVEARRIVEQNFDNNRWWTLLGDQTVVSGDTNANQKTISIAEYHADIELARAALIAVRVKKDLVHGRFSWGNWLGLSQGARYLINVVPTADGNRETAKTDVPVRKPGFAYFQFVDLSVEDIVESEYVKKNIDRFRVVKGRGTIGCTELGKRVASANKSEPILMSATTFWWNTFKFPCNDAPIKFIALLKFDSFDRKWKLVAWDLARAQEDFTSHSVTEYLAKS
jgi:hypothetical protein